ncbi:MAG: NosD domain-containing protein [Candidatus Methanomethylicaceae archaeon]
MRGKIPSQAFLILWIVFISLPILIPQSNSQLLKASWNVGKIYIRNDGSIDPPNAPIKTEDKIVYTLMSDIISSDSGIIVERDNIVIDGAGYTLQGMNKGDGILLENRKNITIKNMEIKNFSFGIFLVSSFNNTINKNSIANSKDFGIAFWNASHNVISENNIMNNNVCGIILKFSSNNIVNKNNIANNSFGIFLLSHPSRYIYLSDNNSISDNNMTNNKYGIILADSFNNVINKNNIAYSECSIFLEDSFNNNIINNSFLNGGLFIRFFNTKESYNNTITNNFLNDKPIIYLEKASNIIVQKNAGQVILVRCSNIKIESLNISNATVGIELLETRNSIISKNNIINNEYGIYLYSSFNNSINGNSITNNKYGVFLDFSDNNTFYHNNFIGNDKNVGTDFLSENIWDNGYYGNYWDNYNGIDRNNDDIGDTPYIINEKNMDRYPLIKQVTELNISINSIIVHSLLTSEKLIKGYIIEISGGVSPPLSNIIVKLLISLNNETWTQLNSTRTSQNGNYNLSFNSLAYGNIYIKVVTEETKMFISSESSVFSIYLKSPTEIRLEEEVNSLKNQLSHKNEEIQDLIKTLNGTKNELKDTLIKLNNATFTANKLAKELFKAREEIQNISKVFNNTQVELKDTLIKLNKIKQELSLTKTYLIIFVPLSFIIGFILSYIIIKLKSKSLK